MERDAGDRFGNLVLVLLFPGYLAYHFSVNLGLFNGVLGGYFGVVSLMLLPLLLLFGLLQTLNRGLEFYELLVFSFLGLSLVWALAHYLAGVPESGTTSVFLSTTGSTVLLLALFLAARLFRAGPNAWLYLAVSFGLVAIVGSNLDEGLFLNVIFGISADSEEYVSYQGYARSVLVASLLAVVAARGFVLSLLIVAAAATLFVIGARAEFAGFVLTILAMVPFWLLMGGSTLFYCFLFLVGAALVLVGASIDITQYRVLELLTIQESTSFQSRQVLTIDAWNAISNSPLLGAYGSHAPGSYAHNALGAWVSFGVLGFVIYIYLILHALIGSFWRMVRASRIDALVAAAYVFNFYSLVMVIAAKHVSDPVIALGWGFYAAVLWRQRNKNRRSARLEPVAHEGFAEEQGLARST